MKTPKEFKGFSNTTLIWSFVLLLGLILILTFRLSSLTHGVSFGEVNAANASVGWHGIFHSPLYLPLKVLRSIVFFVSPVHGALLTRLPNTVFGLLSVASFGTLIYLWHGKRIAILTTLLFACSAWTLHVSRLASFDVLYLWGMLALLLSHVFLYRHADHPVIWYGNLFLWGSLLTVPGFVWLVVLDMYLQRTQLIKGWKQFSSWWQRLLSAVALFIWLPLVIKDVRYLYQLKLWLGLPAHFPGLLKLIKQFVAVAVHLFIRGPQYPSLWLGKAPVLDAFTLVITLIGIYFYATHRKNSRSHLLAAMTFISVILIGLGGAVSFSLIVPLAYLVAATGIAYLLHSWLKIFPHNPLARGLGIGLISLAVAVSCMYNLRSYFVAWPLNPTTVTTFSYHLR